MFFLCSHCRLYCAPVPDTPNLRPASREELTQSLSFALRFNGRKRVHSADELMARITAERLVEYLELAWHVVMCKPPQGPHGKPGNHAERVEQAIKLQRGEERSVVVPGRADPGADWPGP
jgi:hypothetical protein